VDPDTVFRGISRVLGGFSPGKVGKGKDNRGSYFLSMRILKYSFS
jgi:hypothetical protein